MVEPVRNKKERHAEKNKLIAEQSKFDNKVEE